MSSEMNSPWAVWAIVVAWGVAVVLATVQMPQGAASFVLGWYVMRPFGFLLKILFALQVCRFFVEARRNGALEMLLCTPLPTRDILRGQSLALRRTFLWPGATFLALLFVPLGPQISRLIATADYPGILTLIAGSVSTLICAAWMVADVFAIYWFGLWLALSAKKPNLAPALTILFVLVLPAPVSFCRLDILADLFFILWGATKLQQDLRWIVSQQYQVSLPTSRRPAPTDAAGAPPIIPR